MRAETLRRGREERGDIARLRQGKISMSFIKSQARREANREWGTLVSLLDRKRSYTTLRRPRGNIPKILRELQKAPKELASRFFQLASGHAMIAPFLKEKFGWLESDMCWWCGRGRQTREHLFKECSTWKERLKSYGVKLGRLHPSTGRLRGEVCIRAGKALA